MVNTDHIVAHMRSNPRMVYKLKRVPGSRISGNRYSEVVDSGE